MSLVFPCPGSFLGPSSVLSLSPELSPLVCLLPLAVSPYDPSLPQDPEAPAEPQVLKLLPGPPEPSWTGGEALLWGPGSRPPDAPLLGVSHQTRAGGQTCSPSRQAEGTEDRGPGRRRAGRPHPSAAVRRPGCPRCPSTGAAAGPRAWWKEEPRHLSLPAGTPGHGWCWLGFLWAELGLCPTRGPPQPPAWGKQDLGPVLSACVLGTGALTAGTPGDANSPAPAPRAPPARHPAPLQGGPRVANLLCLRQGAGRAWSVCAPGSAPLSTAPGCAILSEIPHAPA